MSILKDYDLEITQPEENVCEFKMKCPYCGNVFTQDRYRDRDLTREIIDRSYIRYGSPIRKCEACGEEFLDRSMREAALQEKAAESVLTQYHRRGAIELAVGAAVAAVCLFADFEIAGLLGLAGVGLMLLGITRLLAKPSGLKTQSEMKIELAASKERVSDEAYMQRLRENGIVPGTAAGTQPK